MPYFDDPPGRRRRSVDEIAAGLLGRGSLAPADRTGAGPPGTLGVPRSRKLSRTEQRLLSHLQEEWGYIPGEGVVGLQSPPPSHWRGLSRDPIRASRGRKAHGLAQEVATDLARRLGSGRAASILAEGVEDPRLRDEDGRSYNTAMLYATPYGLMRPWSSDLEGRSRRWSWLAPPKPEYMQRKFDEERASGGFGYPSQMVAEGLLQGLLHDAFGEKRFFRDRIESGGPLHHSYQHMVPALDMNREFLHRVLQELGYERRGEP